MAGCGLWVTYESEETVGPGSEHSLAFISTALCLLKSEHSEKERMLTVMEFRLCVSISLFPALGTWAAREHL